MPKFTSAAQAEKELKAFSSTKTVTKSMPGVPITEEKEAGDLVVFEAPPCTVKVSLGSTVNLGDFSSGRADVSIAIPCGHDEVDAVFDFAKSWTEGRLLLLVEEMLASKGA